MLSEYPVTELYPQPSDFYYEIMSHQVASASVHWVVLAGLEFAVYLPLSSRDYNPVPPAWLPGDLILSHNVAELLLMMYSRHASLIYLPECLLGGALKVL